MTFLIVLSILTVQADTLRLEEAYRLAEEAYPLRQQLALQHAISELRADNVGVRYLPTLSIRSQAVYYSNVADLSASGLPGSPPQPSNDQYRVALGVDQLVYDGGVTSQIRALETVQRDLEQGKIEVQLYKLREQVNAAFFGALVFEAQARVLELLRSDLEARLGVMRSLVDNGVSLPSNADILAAELLSVEQQQVEAASHREWALAVLAELTGRPVDADDVLQPPEIEDPESIMPGRDRPEFRVFDLGRSALDEQARLVSRRNRPNVAVFAETAVGRPPGLDFFETDFKPFYSAGLRMNWSPWKWNAIRREKRILGLRKDLLDAEERSFSKQLSIAVRKDESEIRRLTQLIERDGEAVVLRQRIADEAASQLENGVITSTDYVTERNAQSRAVLALEIHRIQLAQARARYLTTIGK